MNFYKRYMGDYGRSTGHLSLQDHGAYTLLLDHYYSSKEPLPADIESGRRICGALTESETESVSRVLDKFFPLKSDGLRHNKRCDEEIGKWNAQASVNKEIGKLGGRPRKTESVTEPITEWKPSPEARSQIPEVRSQNQENSTSTAVDEKPARPPPKKNGHAIDFDWPTFKFLGIQPDDMARWQEAYPAIPVPDEIDRAAAWLQANPANRKSNYMRFLNNWFSRSQERAGRLK